MKLINIGFGNLVAANRLLAVVSPDSAPIKRVIQEARDRGMLIDASYGRKTKSVLLMDTDHVILSALTPEQIYARWQSKNEAVFEEESRFYVYRNNDGTPEEVDVKIGRSNDNFVEITDGLKDGDVVYLYRPYQKKQTEE